MSFTGSKTIEFTHVVNPHLFYFKIQNQINNDVLYIERELKKYVVEFRDEKCAINNRGEYIVGDYVGVYVVSQNKWIRAEIDLIDEDGELIVWATDYGFPLKTPLNLVVLLSDEHEKMCRTTESNIFKGGIFNIFPATSRYDEVEKVVRMIQKEDWDQDCVKQLERLKDLPIQTIFTPQFEADNHMFGSLKIQNAQKICCVGDILANRWATKVPLEKAKRDILNGKSSATWKIERYLDNCGKLTRFVNKIAVEIDKKSTGSNSQCSQTPESSSSNSSTGIDQNEIIRKYIPKVQEARNNVPTRTADERRENRPIARNTTVSKQPTPIPSSSQLLQMEQNTLINNSKLIRILAHNNMEDPIELNDACFTKSVFKGMRKLNFRETYASQRYAWPNLLRGNSLVLVDSQNRGKTMAYLPAICSKVERTLDRQETNTMGAIAIIVCLTANVPKISQLCEGLLQMPLFKCNVVRAIGKRDTVSIMVSLYNGCNILVTTAPCLEELLTKNSNAIKTNRLECIAFENIDSIMEKHRKTCVYIMKELCSRKFNKGQNRQIIVTSRTWQPFLNNFLNEKYISDSVLLIGNYLEAAFYGHVAFEFVPTETKLQGLADKVNALPIRLQKTLVLCNSFEEVETVVKFFRSKDIPTDQVKDIDSVYAKSKVNSFWTKMEGVLVCADEHLKDTGITDAQNIIHFSVPENDFRVFLFRFSAMLDYYCDVKEKPMATSTIFIDHTNRKHLPKFVDLLKRFKQEITNELEAASLNARSINMMERAYNLRFAPICNYVLMHGSSDHQADCQKRHKLLKSDILKEGSSQIECGIVRFHILNIISPSEYIVRPTELQTDENTWTRIEGSDKFVILDAEIQAFYKNANNTKSLIALNLGEKCVIERHDKFYRGEIIEIFSKRHPTDFESCNVRFLDTGDVERYQAHEIFALDEAFQVIPDQAYYLHLTGIVPADLEDDWDPRAVEFITQELRKWTENERSDVIYEANVILSLRNTLVVDIMRLVNIKRGVVHCSLKTFLKNKSYGIFSPGSRKRVLALAKKDGLMLTEKPKSVAKKPNSLESCNTSTPKSDDIRAETQNGFESFSGDENGISDSNLNSNCYRDDVVKSSWEEELNERWASPWKAQRKNVIISHFNSPNDFFIYQNSPKLRQLYASIDEYAKENIEPAMDKSINTPDIDAYCLVRVDSQFNRGKIFEVDFNESVWLKVFLVDTGLIVNAEYCDVFDIPDSLIEFMPFQAIWCNLVGIKPMEQQWTEEMNDAIYDAIDKYGSNLHLHTIRADKSIQFEVTNINIVRHDVVLIAVQDNEEIIINKMIVSIEMAENDPHTANDLQNVPQIVENDEDSDEDWDDEVNTYQHIPDQNASDQKVPAQQVPTPTTEELNFFSHFSEVPPEEFLDFFREAFIEQQRKPQPQPQTRQLQRIEEGNEEPEPKNGADAGYGSFEDDVVSSPPKLSSASEKSVQNSHQIEFVCKRPIVNWWQTEEKIVLRIDAHENVKYGLEVASDYLVYSTKNNDEQIMAVLNLFGPVEFEQITHYVRGLNVIIHLYKSCNILWPRLISTAEKCNRVIEKIEAMPGEEAAGYTENEDKLRPKLGSDSDEEDDEEKNENYLLDPSDDGDDDDIENESI